jgi:isoamylase
MKNFMAILLLSEGTPMIVAGDEFARTQLGNNNAYCQDNETSWLDYSFLDRNEDLFRFTKRMIRFRHAHPAFRRKEFFSGKCAHCDGFDIVWYGPDGKPVDWREPGGKFIAYLLDGRCVEAHKNGTDQDMFILINMHARSIDFTIPDPPQGGTWARVMDTSLPPPLDIADLDASIPEPIKSGTYLSTGRSVILLMGIK